MRDAAAISAQLVDVRNVGTHKVVKLTIHVPEENAMQVMEAFGWPTMVTPVPVALARLDETVTPTRSRSPQSQGASRTEDDSHSGQPHNEGVGTTKERRAFNELSCAQQAGMLSNDRAFRLFLAEKFDMPVPDPDEAAAVIRHHCKVKSRSEITKDNVGWSELVLAYRLWQNEPSVVPA